jgi:HK97 family phage major capsid protein
MDRDYLLRELREAREKRSRLWQELDDLKLRMDAEPENAGLRERHSNVIRAAARANDLANEIEDQLQRGERIEQLAGDPHVREEGTDFGSGDWNDRGVRHPAGMEAPDRVNAVFDRAQHVLEEHIREGWMQSSDADRIDGVLRGGDLHYGLDARYVAACGDPNYRSAFAKLIRWGDGAHLRMTTAEQEAVQQAVAAEEMRAMAVGTGSAGGWALPISIDPTMVLSNAGVVSPLRQLASQRTISTYEYRAITTAGTTATFAAEFTEVADGSPTLAQPDAFVEKAQAFVPFSVEVGMDYPGLMDELGKLFSDAKGILEGEKFTSGAGHGSFEPQGLITGLSGSSVYATGAAGTWAVSDLYAVQNSLSPRWQPDAVWLLSLPVFNTTKRLVASASTVEPQIVSPDGQLLLNKKWWELSTMATSVATGNRIAVYGDIDSAFRIIDRIGMQVELVPHLFGTNRRPTGQRGLYAFWRTTSIVMVNDAARVVQVA